MPNGAMTRDVPEVLPGGRLPLPMRVPVIMALGAAK
jgi:hypothetical protein